MGISKLACKFHTMSEGRKQKVAHALKADINNSAHTKRTSNKITLQY